ncbi:MAG: 2-oxo acid dehydrogenase subunit E2 [Gammaproteobacteria bacterium]|nr:2-oxo acid dehydrogenase subunit E2 [Gammaproteobacteria bacterium]
MSPAARKRAAELGVTVEQLAAAKGGSVNLADVEHAAAAAQPSAAPALAARSYPEFNGYWIKEHFEPSERVNVGLAVSLRQGGLVAPALHDADRKDLTTLMREFMDLVKRVRAGPLRSSEIAEPTITVSSLGEQGVDSLYPIIYPPQVAIIGFGTVLDRPWGVAGRVELRRTLTAVAPDSLDRDVNFRDQMDFDSMDFLNFVIGLYKAFGRDIPETDYPKIFSLSGCLEYFSADTPSGIV